VSKPIVYTFDEYGAIRSNDKRASIRHKFLPESLTQERIIPASSILHSNAAPHLTRWRALWSYLMRSDITIEPHFQITLAGQIVQMIPIIVRADCNYKANAWWAGSQRRGAISFETQDRGAGTLASTSWAPKQLETLAGINAALVRDPRTVIEAKNPVAWWDNGIGYHSQFPEWSVYVGKTCPGATRISQMDALRARVAELVANQ
jgi:hypothetical protein